MEILFDYHHAGIGKIVKYGPHCHYNDLPQITLLDGYKVNLKSCADSVRSCSKRNFLIFRDPNWYSEFAIGDIKVRSKVEIAVIKQSYDCFRVLICPIPDGAAIP